MKFHPDHDTRVVDNRREMLDETEGRWSAVCNVHGVLVTVETRAAAREAALAPQEFCEDCPTPRTPSWDEIEDALARTEETRR